MPAGDVASFFLVVVFFLLGASVGSVGTLLIQRYLRHDRREREEELREAMLDRLEKRMTEVLGRFSSQLSALEERVEFSERLLEERQREETGPPDAGT